MGYASGMLSVAAVDDDQDWRYDYTAPRVASRTPTNLFSYPDQESNSRGCDGARNYCFRSDGQQVIRTRQSTGEQVVVYQSSKLINRLIAVDGAGNAYLGHYVGDSTKNGVLKVSTRGVASWVVGGGFGRVRDYGVDPNQWELSNLHGMAIDSQGNLFMSEVNRGLVVQATAVGDMAPPVPDPQTFGPCDQGGSAASAQVSVCRSDPVNTATGNFVTRVMDLQMGGEGEHFTATRFYNSADPTSGPFGPGWSYSYGASLTPPSPGPMAGTTVQVFRSESGQQLVFTMASDGTVTPDPGGRATLQVGTESYAVRMRDGRRYDFDIAGRLTGVHDRNEQGVTLGRSVDGFLTSITDSHGRVVAATTNSDGTIKTLTLPDGRATSYDYVSGRLTAVHDPAGGVTSYVYAANGKIERIIGPNGQTTVHLAYDTSGRVSEERDALGNLTKFAWDPTLETSTLTDAAGAKWIDVYESNVLKATIDPLGGVTAYRYDGQLNVIAVTEPAASSPPPTGVTIQAVLDWLDNLLDPAAATPPRTTTYAHDDRGNLVSAQAPEPLNYTETRTYNSLDQVLTVTDGRSNTTTFTYDPSGNLTSESAADQPPTIYQRGLGGLLLSITTPGGHKTTLTYDTVGNLTARTDPLGNKTTFSYDSTGRRTTRTSPEGNRVGQSPAGHTTTWTYTPVDGKATETDPRGGTTTWRYDPAGNLTTLEQPHGAVTAYTYNEAGDLTATIDPDARRTTSTYDQRGLKTATTTPEGRTTKWTHDPARRVRTVTTPAGNAPGADPAAAIWSYDYDPYGNRSRVTDPTGARSSTTFDVLDRPLTRTDALGRTTTSEYDATSNLTATVDPAGARTTLAYDPSGRLVSSTDPLERTTTYAYDLDGHRTTQTSPLGNITTWSYDPAGRPRSQTNPRGNTTGAVAADHTTTFGYDADGNRTSVTEPVGRQSTVTYDGVGNPLTVTDPEGAVTSYTYDLAGRVASTTDALAHTTTFAYSPAGDLLTRQGPDGRSTHRAYNGDHQLASETTAAGRITQHTYDAAGRPATVVAPGGISTTSTYDNLDRVVRVDYSDSTPDAAYTYDAAGQILTISDGTGQRTRTYDTVGRLTREQHTEADAISYTYDAAGQVTTRALSTAQQVTYGYDPDGRLQLLDTNLTEPTTFTYDPAGNILSTQLPDGYHEQLGYDNGNRITDVTHTRAGVTLNQLDITRDGTGRPALITGGPTPERYAYDPLGQITNACYTDPCTPASPQIAYTYDNVGNRTTETRNNTTTQTYTYNADNELGQISGPTGTRTAQHDARGNLTRLGDDTYAYDAENRLNKVTTPTAISTYTYDAEGNRATATTAHPLLAQGTTTTYRWDTTYPIAQLVWQGPTNAPTQSHLYGPRGRLLSLDGNQPTYYLHDALGSVITTTDAAHTIWSNKTYEPYGTPRNTTQSLVGPTQQFGFADEQQDSANGLYNLRARTYNPQTGLFLSRDPLEPIPEGPSRSPYLYANNRPTQYVDPTGQREQISQSDATGACGFAFYGAYYDIFTLGLASKLLNGIGHAFGLEPEQQAGCTTLGTVGGTVGATALAGSQIAAATPRLSWMYDDAARAPSTAGGGARFVANTAGDILDTTRITIPDGKFGYLLSNPSKSGVFADSMGFTRGTMDPALRAHLVDNFGTATRSVPMVGGGTKFSVTGPLVGPSGQKWTITTAWGIEPNGTIRLITATP